MYPGVAVMKEKLLVTDVVAMNLQVFNLQDGKLICTSDELEFGPEDVCVLSDTQCAVCLVLGKIVIMTLTSSDGVERVKTLDVSTGFGLCHSVAKWTADKLVVSGERDDMLCWAVFWIKDGRLDSTHDICEGRGTHVTVKHNTVYVSCPTYDSITNGVRAFDLLNPQHEPKFLYQHEELTWPGSIMVDRGYVFVSNRSSNIIHQITDSGQLLTIHRLSSDIYGMFYDDHHGVFYTTSPGSTVMTCYKMEYPHQAGLPIEILKMDDRAIQLFEEALKDGKETVYSIRILFIGSMGEGKTTLIKRLLGEEVNISDRCSTEGIDVHVNCCHVSLSTHEWSRRPKDSEQDYKLQRLVKVLNENYQTGGREVDLELDASSNQRERTDDNPLRHVADDDKNTEVLHHQSQQQNVGQDLTSTSTLQREPSSTVSLSGLTHSETNTIPGSKIGENVATENNNTGPLREMLKLLQQNPDKAKQDVNKYAHLTMLDFAGQYAYYTTHQMFLTRRAIYLLVADASREVGDIVQDECYFDTRGRMKCTVHELVEIWMNSVHSCALPDKESLNAANFNVSSNKVIPPPVILVGTHIDQISQNLTAVGGDYGRQNVIPGSPGVSNPGAPSPVQDDMLATTIKKSLFGRFVQFIRGFVSPDAENPGPRQPIKCDVQTKHEACRKLGQKYLQEIRHYLRDKPTNVHLVDEDFAIDNSVVDSELEKLKKKIVEVASQQPYWGEQIPTRWFLLEQQLMKLKEAGLKVISRITVEDLNKNATVQIKEDEELDVFLKYLHETGTIIYFSIEVLRENIMLDPKWLIDALKSLINAKQNLPDNRADNDTESNNAADNDTESNNPADNDTESNNPAASTSYNITQKWSDFKEKGVLTSELVDAIWTKERYPELHAHKSHILMIMEQLNIVAKQRSFNEMGEKVEDFFLVPCMLHQKSPADVISPEQDPNRMTTPEMSCIFTGKYLPTPIFHRLLAACVARWPVAKKENENLIFCGCCVFDLDLLHRLTLYLKGHIVCAKITRLMKDEIKTPDVKLCSKVRRFIAQNLSKITSYLGLNLQYDLQGEYKTWIADEGYDPDAPLTQEHMNYFRLCAVLITICGSAMREILCTHVPSPHTDIYQAILANKSKLTGRPGKPILNHDQIDIVFPDPLGMTTGNVDHFDISLLYSLIRNISSVTAPVTSWAKNPQDTPRDISLGASVERIRSYRNQIIGHTNDGKISQQEFDHYWDKIDAVLDDIEQALGKQGYRAHLERQKRQVISVFEDCYDHDT